MTRAGPKACFQAEVCIRLRHSHELQQTGAALQRKETYLHKPLQLATVFLTLPFWTHSSKTKISITSIYQPIKKNLLLDNDLNLYLKRRKSTHRVQQCTIIFWSSVYPAIIQICRSNIQKDLWKTFHSLKTVYFSYIQLVTQSLTSVFNFLYYCSSEFFYYYYWYFSSFLYFIFYRTKEKGKLIILIK